MNHLHSNMVLLKVQSALMVVATLVRFTFQYGSIKGMIVHHLDI